MFHEGKNVHGIHRMQIIFVSLEWNLYYLKHTIVTQKPNINNLRKSQPSKVILSNTLLNSRSFIGDYMIKLITFGYHGNKTLNIQNWQLQILIPIHGQRT